MHVCLSVCLFTDGKKISSGIGFSVILQKFDEVFLLVERKKKKGSAAAVLSLQWAVRGESPSWQDFRELQ